MYLIIDAGTAITYDIVNEKGQYLGGNISPGIEMRLKALHQFTGKLPLVQQKQWNKLIWNNYRRSYIGWRNEWYCV